MHYIVSGDITLEKIRQIVWNWRKNKTSGYPKFKEDWDYYVGNQKILRKKYKDKTKPCNKVVTNFCRQITTNYQGYCTGIPVNYEVEDKIRDFLNYNDVQEKDNLLLRNALIYGKSFEIQYIDDNKQNRFGIIDTLSGLDIYGDDLENDELKAFCYFFKKDNYDDSKLTPIYCDIYTSDEIIHTKMSYDYAIIEEIGREPHYFQQVPVVVFSLNGDEESIFEQIKSLQDGYNEVVSSRLDDNDAYVDAYLVLTYLDAQPEDIQAMRENRCLLLNNKDSKAEFLTKPSVGSTTNDIIANLKENIFKMSNTPDFTDNNFATSSGIALKFKMEAFNNASKDIITRMEKALRKRIELFEDIEAIKGESFADITITFTLNIPFDELEYAKSINEYRGLVSDVTLLGQIPFIKDIEAEEKLLKDQKDNAQVQYGFVNRANGDNNEQVRE